MQLHKQVQRNYESKQIWNFDKSFLVTISCQGAGIVTNTWDISRTVFQHTVQYIKKKHVHVIVMYSVLNSTHHACVRILMVLMTTLTIRKILNTVKRALWVRGRQLLKVVHPKKGKKKIPQLVSHRLTVLIIAPSPPGRAWNSVVGSFLIIETVSLVIKI